MKSPQEHLTTAEQTVESVNLSTLPPDLRIQAAQAHALIAIAVAVLRLDVDR